MTKKKPVFFYLHIVWSFCLPQLCVIRLFSVWLFWTYFRVNISKTVSRMKEMHFTLINGWEKRYTIDGKKIAKIKKYYKIDSVPPYRHSDRNLLSQPRSSFWNLTWVRAASSGAGLHLGKAGSAKIRSKGGLSIITLGLLNGGRFIPPLPGIPRPPRPAPRTISRVIVPLLRISLRRKRLACFTRLTLFGGCIGMISVE